MEYKYVLQIFLMQHHPISFNPNSFFGLYDLPIQMDDS